MLKTNHLLRGLFFLSLFMSIPTYACQSDADCMQWAESNCACGVRATCIGLTSQSQTGHCQCYGASGNCKADTEEAASDTYVVPGRRRVAPRATPGRRGVRSGRIDVDVSR